VNLQVEKYKVIACFIYLGRLFFIRNKFEKLFVCKPRKILVINIAVFKVFNFIRVTLQIDKSVIHKIKNIKATESLFQRTLSSET